MSDVVIPSAVAPTSQTVPKVVLPSVNPPVPSPLQQLLELVSRKHGPDSKGESPTLDDEFVMKYINSVASSFAIPVKPPKQASPSDHKDSKFDFSVLLPKNELRDHPIDHLWFSNKGQCFGIDRSMEETRPSPPSSPQSDILPPSPTNYPSSVGTKPLSESRISCKDKTLPFDLESYQDLTSPISDLTYNVLPFATSAKVLDLSAGSLSPKELPVEGIKLLDIWDVLGWFALDYLLSAETLAEVANGRTL